MLIFDVDGTLSAPVGAQGRGFDGWVEQLYNTDAALAHPAVPLAVARLIQQHPGEPRLVLTSRSVDLTALTAEWIWRNIPALRDAPLSLRPHHDDAPAFISKRIRLAQLREGRVTLVEDDWRMRRFLHRKDRFIFAASLWQLGLERTA